ncbi:DNA cytosine methyltransferase [Brasilonema sp. UFV-L1]
MNKPKLSDNAPTLVDLCSCGGGIKTGAILAGVRPLVGIEYDPKEPGLSQHYKFVQNVNFAEYGSTLQLQTVQAAAASDFAGVPRNPTILHASPPCTNYTKLRTLNKTTETLADIEIGQAVSSAIATLTPEYFTLECSPSYVKGMAYLAIKNALQACSYHFKAYELDMMDYNTPQSRRRTFIMGWRSTNRPLKLPPKTRRIGWLEAIGWEDRKIVQPSKKQMDAIIAYFEKNHPSPIMVDKIGVSNKSLAIRQQYEPMWTITTSYFTDQNSSQRTSSLTYYHEEKMYALRIRDVARLCGFPDWYAPSNVYSLAGKVLGNAVCPSFYSYFLKSNNLGL